MVPAMQSVLAVNCADPSSMFNKNAGSDELRYLRQLPDYLSSLEYPPADIGRICSTSSGQNRPPPWRLSGHQP